MGRKILNTLKRKDAGAIGIGAMIVFIAMVLVAGIAASVLVQTSTTLQSRAMTSGQRTIAEVATGVAVEEVEGWYDGTDTIDEIAIHVRVRAGSSDVDLSQTIVELSDSATKNILRYDSTNFKDTSDINGDLFGLNAFDGDATQFRVVVLEDADDSCSSTSAIINKGDHVILAVDTNNCFSGLATRNDVFGQVIPEDGSPGVISFTTPASYQSTEPVIELQ